MVLQCEWVHVGSLCHMLTDVTSTSNWLTTQHTPCLRSFFPSLCDDLQLFVPSSKIQDLCLWHTARMAPGASHMKTAIYYKSDRWQRKRELLRALLKMTFVIRVPTFTDEKSPKIYDLATPEKQRHFEMKVLCGWMIWSCPQWKIHFEQFQCIFFFIPFSFPPLLRSRKDFCSVLSLLLLPKLSTEKVYGCCMLTFLQFCFHRNTESRAGMYFRVT